MAMTKFIYLYACSLMKNILLDVLSKEVDLEIKENDPINLWQALQSFHAHKWIDAMNEEIKSMHGNDVWDLV